MLYQAGRAGKYFIGGGGRHDNQVNVAGLNTRRFDGFSSGCFGQVCGKLTFCCDVAFADTGSAVNPFIRGIDHFLQIMVGQAFLRQVAAGACYF